MSELKEVMNVMQVSGERIPSGYYKKSEADKVIAEKDKEIQRLEKLCESYRIDCDNLAITTDRMRKVGRTLREKMSHQKYKRCFAMARWCASRSLAWMADPADEALHESDFYDRWKLRWLELAKMFKEARDEGPA